MPTNPDLVRDRAGRGRASTRASLDPPPPVSAGSSPSAAPGRRGVDRPARACALDRTRSTTATPGSSGSVSWGCFPSSRRSGVRPNCVHTPPSVWGCLCYIDRKSISGAVHLFNASPITWTSTKQKIQALSTCEAEYVSATAAVQTTQWLRRILRFLGLQQSTPTPLFMDNQAAIAVAQNTAATKKRTYIDLRQHYLREHIRLGHIQLHHVPFNRMLADIFTKPLLRTQFSHMKTGLHLG